MDPYIARATMWRQLGMGVRVVIDKIQTCVSSDGVHVGILLTIYVSGIAGKQYSSHDTADL